MDVLEKDARIEFRRFEKACVTEYGKFIANREKGERNVAFISSGFSGEEIGSQGGFERGLTGLPQVLTCCREDVEQLYGRMVSGKT